MMVDRRFEGVSLMQIRRLMSSSSHCRVVGIRRAFTLIEILMVIVIIAILIAVLMPAVWSVRTRAREAQISTEITSLANALADFKAEFGAFPPSSITLKEESGSGINGAWDVEDATHIRRFWPHFNFKIARDIDGDGTSDETFVLTGAECLVFFLGGLTEETTDSSGNPVYSKVGFSRNPADPFSKTLSTPLGPFHEFKASRLIDIDDDGALEYCDPSATYNTPIVYISSGGGYDEDDLEVFGDNRDLNEAYKETADLFYNPTTYQLISPGLDKTYGNGGIKDDWNAEEKDNITNLNGGRLDQLGG
jgi:prepilin-type N-terminal cleavage/methylation domain-containing protein